MRRLALKCLDLSKRFGEVQAVADLGLAVELGNVLSLVGPSACGKTTVLRLIAGFEVADSGTVEIVDRLIAGPGHFLPPERRRVGMVFQDYALFPHMNVEMNIAYGLSRPSRDDRRARLKEVLSLTGLTGLDKRMPHELSGGQQQRVALARALAPRPLILLLDEPFSNLDPALRIHVRREVKELLKASGTTVVFVTHDQEEALFMGDTVAVMNKGTVQQVATPEDIFHAPETQFVATFMGTAHFIPARLIDGLLITEAGSLRAPDSLGLNDNFEIMVRPDDLSIAPDPAGNAVIVERTFQGAFYIYEARLSSGLELQCLAPHPKSFAVGTRVNVLIDPGHALNCFTNGRLFGKAEPVSQLVSHH